MRPIAEVPLHLVQDDADLTDFEDWLVDAWNSRQPVAIDTETTGLNPFGPHRDTIRLVQFGTVDEGWAVPFRGNRAIIHWAVTGGPTPIGYNAIFDEAFLAEAGIQRRQPWLDGYIAHHLLFPADYHSLKSAAGNLLGRECRSGEKWLQKVKTQNRWDWATTPIDHPAYWGYGALDAVLTARLWELHLAPPLSKFQEQYDREVRMAHLTTDQSRRGLRIDVPYVERMLDGWVKEEAELAGRLARYQVESPNSAKQVVDALQNEGWEPDLLTETGQVCVNRAILESLDHEIADDVLRWRRLRKWRSSYGEPLLESGGRIHPIISSLRASTGRMSVSEPPLHQLPRGPEVRNAILPEEGQYCVAVDYTGQEMRLLSAYAEDEGLTDTVLNGGDVHGRIAAELFGSSYTPEQRGWTKNAVYAFAYGAAPARMASTAHAPPGAAERAIGQAFPGIIKFSSGVDKVAKRRLKEDGTAWAKTAGGRLVAAPKSKLYALRNFLLQGSGADLLKMAMERIDQQGQSDDIMLPVHDELILSVDNAEQAESVRQAMSTEFRGVPFVAHASKLGPSWGAVA